MPATGKRKLIIALTLVAAATSPAYADSHDAAIARLAAVISAPQEGDGAAVAFEQVGTCQFVETWAPSEWNFGTWQATTEIDFSAADFDQTGTEIDDESNSGVVEISNSAEADVVSYRTDYFDVPEEGQLMLGNIGGTCDGDTCVREGMRDSYSVVLSGDDLETRLAAVEADLLALGAACAPN